MPRFCFVVFVLLSLRLPAQDTIYFKNGDRLSGRIKNMQRGTLLFSCPALDGDARVGWNRIARIDSDRTFQFEASSGERFLGTIRKNDVAETEASEIAIERAGDARQFKQSDIILAVETLGKSQSLIEMDVGAGMNLTKSNSLRQFNVDSEFRLTLPRRRLDASFNSIFTTQSQTSATQRHEFQIEGAQSISPKWDILAVGSLLKSQEQKLDLRTTLGGGFGYSLIQSNRSRLQAVMGSVWTSERYQPDSGIEARESAEALLGVSFALFKFKMWTADSTFYLLPSYTTSGRYRFNGNVSFRWRLIEGKNFWWSFSEIYNYDNKPPSNAPGTDYVTQTSLSWSFP